MVHPTIAAARETLRRLDEVRQSGSRLSFEEEQPASPAPEPDALTQWCAERPSDPHAIRQWLARCPMETESISAWGFIVGHLLEDSRLSPAAAVGINLVFLSIYDEGQAYTETEYRNWLAEAGFSDICVQYGAAAGGASIVVARKKD
jgi:hypothetical protein